MLKETHFLLFSSISIISIRKKLEMVIFLIFFSYTDECIFTKLSKSERIEKNRERSIYFPAKTPLVGPDTLSTNNVPRRASIDVLANAWATS